MFYLLSLPLKGPGFGTLPGVAVLLPAVVNFVPCLLSLPCARDLGLALCLLSLSFERLSLVFYLLSLPLKGPGFGTLPAVAVL